MLTYMVLVPMVTALETKRKPANAFHMLTTCNLFNYRLTLTTSLAVLRQLQLLLGNTLHHRRMHEFITIVTVLLPAFIAKINRSFLKNRLN